VQQPALDLWRRAVFVDWHGVLSRSRFWASILDDEGHPLRSQLQTGLDRLFGDDERLAGWMTGKHSADQVVEGLGIEPVGRYTTSYLRLQLDRDCRTMPVNVTLMRMLRAVRDRAFVVIATDNSDSFAQTYRRSAARRGHWRETKAQTLAAWATCADDLICSSEVGTCKAEDPDAFFGPYLRASGLGFEDSLLIDDAEHNCEAFRSLGGTAICWSMDDDPLEPLAATVHEWVRG
jgi:hypothetical protein